MHCARDRTLDIVAEGRGEDVDGGTVGVVKVVWLVAVDARVLEDQAARIVDPTNLPARNSQCASNGSTPSGAMGWFRIPTLQIRPDRIAVESWVPGSFFRWGRRKKVPRRFKTKYPK